VTLVTPHPMVAFELVRTAADFPLRRKLKRQGVVMLTESAVQEWRGDGAVVIDLRDGSAQQIAADALILATCNRANTTLADDLAGSGLEMHPIGDCVAPRHANMAFYEGRALGRRL
jgi:pyruvate/2-oxoglutarate dehydrogenase complex dihydrolipoamide dehydrogenase (E3) component